MLVAGDERGVVERSQKRHGMPDAQRPDERVELGPIRAVASHRVEDVGTPLQNFRQRANQHVLSLALLQRAGRQNDGPIAPAQTGSHILVTRRRHEPSRIDARCQDDDLAGGYMPRVEQKPARVLAVGDDPIRAAQHEARPPAKLAARPGERQFLPVHVDPHGHAMHAADAHADEPFGQAFAAVHRRGPEAPRGRVGLSKGRCVHPRAARGEQTPRRKRGTPALDGQRRAAVELGVVRRARGEHRDLDVVEPAVELPQPAPRSAMARREGITEQENSRRRGWSHRSPGSRPDRRAAIV